MLNDLHSLTRWTLDPAGVEYQVTPEPENAGYSAAVLQVGDVRLRVRQARLTPTKPGAFVAVWKRSPAAGTEPFNVDDAGAGLIVFVADSSHTGVFRFTVEHLVELGVVRTGSTPGKRGFRVYPPWCEGLNPQATRTQRDQAHAFIELTEGDRVLTADQVLRRLNLT